jgi:DNA-binding NarL/FixJ family response regulator
MSNAGRAPIRVLVVDDHPLVRRGLRVLLAAGGDAEVLGEATDGKTAVEMTGALRPEVVLMDWLLPNLSGPETTKVLLAAHPWVRVLGFSALDDAASAHALLEAGAAGYALKSCSPAELASAVRAVADGGTYLAPKIEELLAQRAGRRVAGQVNLARLSPRESEVLRRIAQGQTLRDVAGALDVSPRTLETYKARAMSKLKLTSRSDLIRHAVRCGWLQGD